MIDFELDDRLSELMLQATTLEQIEAIDAMRVEAIEVSRIAAREVLARNSKKMLEKIAELRDHTAQLAAAVNFANHPSLLAFEKRLGALHLEQHSFNVTSAAEDAAVADHSAQEPQSIDGAETRALGATTAPLITPIPENSTEYANIADEYVEFFLGAGVASGKKTQVEHMAKTAWAHRATYEEAGSPLGIPWWFIAGLHQMESTYNFKRHLHNGDPLDARTVQVPAGRPVAGNPPFTFAESTTDALVQKGFDGKTDWSLPRALYRFEAYNGWGYRPRGIATPYLWGFSTLHEEGKYVADGTFDANAITKQCGVATMLRELANMGHVSFESAQFRDVDQAADGPLINTPAATTNRDTLSAAGHPFEAFWNATFNGGADVPNFTWSELLYKGASHAGAPSGSKNVDPPLDKYQNVVTLVRVLQRIRSHFNAPVNLLSVFRGPDYNAHVGGARDSRHKVFDAADFHVVGAGSPGDWADFAKTLRSAGEFEGGVGIYNSFVHIDTRGTRANWVG